MVSMGHLIRCDVPCNLFVALPPHERNGYAPAAEDKDEQQWEQPRHDTRLHNQSCQGMGLN